MAIFRRLDSLREGLGLELGAVPVWILIFGNGESHHVGLLQGLIWAGLPH